MIDVSLGRSSISGVMHGTAETETEIETGAKAAAEINRLLFLRGVMAFPSILRMLSDQQPHRGRCSPICTETGTEIGIGIGRGK